MLNFKAGLFVTVSLASATFALDAHAITRVTPVSQPILVQSAQTVADADGPSTGGGDTPYLSTKPAQPGAEPTKPTEAAPAQAATPAPTPAPDTAATTPPTPAPTAPVKAAEPVVPPNPTPAPAAAEATPVPTTPATAEKSQETQAPAVPTPAATPAPQPAPEAPVQAATPPPPATPVTPVPAVVPAPQPINPQIPLQATTPVPIEPPAPVQAATPEPVAPATPPPAVAVQPQPSQPTVGATDQKPKQQLAKKKPKPVHKPDVVVRNVPRGPVHRVPDDDDMLYADGPVPPMPIGRRHVVIEADNGYDDGYVVVRRYHRCEPHVVSGFWPFHREVRCY